MTEHSTLRPSEEIKSLVTGDIMYSLAFKGRAGEKRELLRLRREQLEFNQNMLLGRPSFVMADILKDALSSVQLIALGLGYEKYRDRVSGPAERGAKSGGSFFIWRE